MIVKQKRLYTLHIHVISDKFCITVDYCKPYVQTISEINNPALQAPDSAMNIEQMCKRQIARSHSFRQNTYAKGEDLKTLKKAVE